MEVKFAFTYELYLLGTSQLLNGSFICGIA